MAAAEERDMEAHKRNGENFGVDPAIMDKAAVELKEALLFASFSSKGRNRGRSPSVSGARPPGQSEAYDGVVR